MIEKVRDIDAFRCEWNWIFLESTNIRFQDIVETYESTYQDHFKCFYDNTGKKFAKCVFTLPDQGKRDFWGCRVDITKDIQRARKMASKTLKIHVLS